MRFSRRDATWYCDNCFDSISMEELLRREYFTPSGAIKPEAVKRGIVPIVIILAIFITIFIGAFIFAFTVRHNVTITVYSENYNGPVRIFIDGDEVYSEDIVVGETIEKTFSLRGDRYRFTIKYGDKEINDIEEIDYEEELNYTLR
jgi:hypothetical protein